MFDPLHGSRIRRAARARCGRVSRHCRSRDVQSAQAAVPRNIFRRLIGVPLQAGSARPIERRKARIKMTVDLYYVPPSPPCRMVIMLAKALGVRLNLKLIDIFNGEHTLPEYTKINQQRLVPALDDNGFVLSESRPIMGYLVNKYAKNDSLYPKDPRKKGLVDQRLYFDIESLYGKIFPCWIPVAFKMASEVEEKNVLAVEKSFEILNVFLEDSDYVAGENLTIADFSILVSVSMAEIFGFDVARYDNVAAWFDRCKVETAKYGYDDFIAASSPLGEMLRANVQAS